MSSAIPHSGIISIGANMIIGSVYIDDVDTASTGVNSDSDLDVISISLPDYIEVISLDSNASDILPELVTLRGSGGDSDQNATSDSLPASSGDVEMGVHEVGATGAC